MNENEAISDEKHEAGFGFLLFWICTALLIYVLSIGPAAWLHEKISSARMKAGLETIYAPVGFLIHETPLRQAGEWWVSKWVDLLIPPGPKR